MSTAYTKRQMARKLHCDDKKVDAEADALGIPYRIREGVRGDGEPFTYRTYFKATVDEFFLELGRVGARRAAS